MRRAAARLLASLPVSSGCSSASVTRREAFVEHLALPAAAAARARAPARTRRERGRRWRGGWPAAGSRPGRSASGSCAPARSSCASATIDGDAFRLARRAPAGGPATSAHAHAVVGVAAHVGRQRGDHQVVAGQPSSGREVVEPIDHGEAQRAHRVEVAEVGAAVAHRRGHLRQRPLEHPATSRKRHARGFAVAQQAHERRRVVGVPVERRRCGGRRTSRAARWTVGQLPVSAAVRSASGTVSAAGGVPLRWISPPCVVSQPSVGSSVTPMSSAHRAGCARAASAAAAA